MAHLLCFIISPQWIYGSNKSASKFMYKYAILSKEKSVLDKLKYRDFNVDVGVVEYNHRNEAGKSTRSRIEIDFIASKGSRK